jgi:hypothetical protein
MNTLAAHAQAAISGSNDRTGTFAVKVTSPAAPSAPSLFSYSRRVHVAFSVDPMHISPQIYQSACVGNCKARQVTGHSAAHQARALHVFLSTAGRPHT